MTGHGGTALDATILDNGSTLKRRSASTRVIIDLASVPGSLGSGADRGFAYLIPLSLMRVSLSGPTV